MIYYKLHKGYTRQNVELEYVCMVHIDFVFAFEKPMLHLAL